MKFEISGEKVQQFLENCWYVELEAEKHAGNWGGWQENFEENPKVYTYEEICEKGIERVGIVGYNREDFGVVFLDVDAYKFGEEKQEKVKKVIEKQVTDYCPVFKSTEKLSYHIPFVCLKNVKVPNTVENVDVCGSVDSKRLVVAPEVEYGSTKLPINDKKPPLIPSTEEIRDYIPEILLKSRNKDKVSVDYDFSSVTIGKDGELPKETSPCLKSIVKKREKDTQEFEEDLQLVWFLHEAGLSKEEAFKFLEDHTPEEIFDEKKTSYQVKYAYTRRPKQRWGYGCKKMKQLGNCPGECGRQHPFAEPKEDSSYKTDIPTVTKDVTKNVEQLRNILSQISSQNFKKGFHSILKVLQGAGKTHTGVIAGVDAEKTSVFFFDRYEHKKQVLELLAKYREDAVMKELEGASRKCPTLNGMHDGNEEAEKVKNLYYSLGIRPKTLHKLFDLPCQPDCPYIEQYEEDYEKYDIVFAPLEFSQLKSLIVGKNVIFDEGAFSHLKDEETFKADLFFDIKEMEKTVFGKVASGDAELIEETNTNEKGNIENYKMILGKQKTEGEIFGEKVQKTKAVILEEWEESEFLEYCVKSDVPPKIWDFLKTWKQGRKVREKDKHAPKIFRKWENETVKIAAGSSTKGHFSRDNENKYIYREIKKPPIYLANSSLILDATADKFMWSQSLQGKSKMIDLNSKALHNELGMTVIKHTNNINYVHGYSSEILEKESKTFDKELVEFLEEIDGQFALISSKKVVNDAIELNLVDREQTAYYGNLKGLNKLKKYDKIVVIGAPHPGHEEIILDCALFFGYDAQPEGRGKDLKYGRGGEMWEKILKYHREYKIHHGIHRIRPLLSEETKIHLFTACIPETIPIHVDETNDEPQDAPALIKRFLQKSPRTKTRKIAKKLDYSPQHVRRVCKKEKEIVNRGSDDTKVWSIDLKICSNIFNNDVRKIVENLNFSLSFDEVQENVSQSQKSLKGFLKVIPND